MHRRACLIVTGILPPDVGGPATYAPRIAAALQDRGWQCEIVTLADAGTVAEPMPVPVWRIRRSVPFFWRTAATTGVIGRRARRSDVVFANGLLFESALAAAVARRPVVAKIVGDEVWERSARRGWTTLELEEFQRTRRSGRAQLAHAIRAWSLRGVQRIIAPSHYTARLMGAWARRLPRIDVVHNAAESLPDDGAFELPPALASCRLMAAVGRLIPLKRIDGLIDSLALLPGVALVVAGDGPERSRLERLAVEHGVSDRILFTGPLPRGSVVSVMRRADLLVLNSTTENCPHVILEAMSAGCPVVATRVGGVPELVDDGVTGVLVEPDDADGMRRAIRRVLDNEELRRQLGAAGRGRLARFSWDAHAERVDAILREVAEVSR